MEHAKPNSPTEQLPIDEFASLGSVLSMAREACGLSIEQVAAELRVESRFLEALEQDRLDMFSAPVFVKGYLKHLANRLGLQYEDLLTRYARQTDISDAPLTYIEPLPSLDVSLMPVVVGSLILLLGISAFWFTWVGRDTGFGFDFLRPEAPVLEPADILPVPEDMSELADRDVAAGLPVPVAADMLAPAQVQSTETASEAPSVPAPATAAVPDTPGADQAAGTIIQVVIRFDEDSWSEVNDGTGDSLYYGLGRADTTASFDGTLPMSFTLGNSLGVQISINDQPYSLPTPTGGDTLVRFVVAEAP